jgi:hypothetical protein
MASMKASRSMYISPESSFFACCSQLVRVSTVISPGLEKPTSDSLTVSVTVAIVSVNVEKNVGKLAKGIGRVGHAVKMVLEQGAPGGVRC